MKLDCDSHGCNNIELLPDKAIGSWILYDYMVIEDIALPFGYSSRNRLTITRQL